MAPQLTKQQRDDLVDQLRALKTAHGTYLRKVVEKAARDAEHKVHKRIKNVSMTVRSVPISRVLDAERHASPTLAQISKFAESQEKS